MLLSANRGILRRLAYLPQLQSLARVLGLSGFLRRWYYRLALPPDGIVDVNLGRIAAQFYAHTPIELRDIETGGGELHILERLISVLRAGDIAYDIGAHIGLYTVLLAKAVDPEGQVIAFEPDGENYGKLEENIKLNSLANVKLFRRALGEGNSQAKLYKGDDLPASTLMSPRTGKDITYEVVEVVDGDSFREAENLPIPRAVKIDVEGYEYTVLQGLQETLAQPACELVCCEIHPTLLPEVVEPEMILSFLQSLGFRRIDSNASNRRHPLFHIIAYKGASAASESAFPCD